MQIDKNNFTNIFYTGEINYQSIRDAKKLPQRNTLSLTIREINEFIMKKRKYVPPEMHVIVVEMEQGIIPSSSEIKVELTKKHEMNCNNKETGDGDKYAQDSSPV